jgi:hypothetical protein
MFDFGDMGGGGGMDAFRRLLGMLLPGTQQSIPYMGMGTEFGRPTGSGGGYEGYFKQPQYGFLEMGASMLGRQLPTPQLEMPGRYRMQMDMQNRFRAMNQEMMWRSPTFEHVMTQGIGRMTGRSFEASKQLIQGNQMLRMIRSAGSYGWNMFASPYTDQYSQIPMMASEAYRQFASAPMTMSPGGQGQMGFTYQQSKQFATRLYEATRGASGIFQKGPFDPRQMMEIASITQAYGGFSNLGSGKGAGGQMGGMEEMVRRTKDVAKVINLGMRVYGEMDKQKVVERIMELTRGTVGLQQTGTIETLLHRVDAMARTANMSVDLMQKIAAEGADIARRVNVRGNVGAVQAMQAVVTANVATAGPNALINQSMVNFLGGQNQVVRMMAGINTGFMQRAAVQDLGALVGAGMPGGAGGGLSIGQARGLMDRGMNLFQTQNMIMSRAIAQARAQGRPTSDAYAIAATMRNPRLRMEGQSAMLEAMQEDPTSMMETQMSMIAGSLRGNMGGGAWKQILQANQTERESLLYEAMMHNPNAVIEAGGDPSNMLGIAHMLSKGLQAPGAKKLFMYSAEERTKMQRAGVTQLAHMAENIGGMRNLEDRSAFERFQNAFSNVSTESFSGSILEAILPSGGALDKGGVSPALLKAAGMINAADLTSSQASQANTLLIGSRMLAGGEDIFSLADKKSKGYERMQFMRSLGRAYGTADAAEGDKILKDRTDLDELKQIVREADAGMDWNTIGKLHGKLGQLDSRKTASVLKALGASDTSINAMRAMGVSVSGVIKGPDYQELKGAIERGAGKAGDFEKDYNRALGEYRTATEKERASAHKDLRTYVKDMHEDISLGVSRQFEADKKLTSAERTEKEEQTRKIIKAAIGTGRNVDEAIGNWKMGSMKELTASIADDIIKNQDLSPEQVKVLQEQIGNMAQYALNTGAGRKSKARKQAREDYYTNREKARKGMVAAYSSLEEAKKMYEYAQKGEADIGEDVAYSNLREAQKRASEQKGEFLKYGGSEKEAAKYKDETLDVMTEILIMLKQFFANAREYMGNSNGADSKGAGDKAKSAAGPTK